MTYQSIMITQELSSEFDVGKENPVHACLPRSNNVTRHRSKPSCCSPQNFLVTSKPAVLILLWTVIVGGVDSYAHYNLLRAIKASSNFSLPRSYIWICLIEYVICASIKTFYILGGLAGDVRLGRFQTVIIGLIVILVSMVIAGIDEGLFYEADRREDIGIDISATSVSILSFAIGILGFSAYNSNIVQLGLDQLMEESSESLGVFVHWFVWSVRVGPIISLLLKEIGPCAFINDNISNVFKITTYLLPTFYSILLIVFLSASCCIRKKFSKDRVKYNPYKMILKVLNFARKHKYPVGPTTAFAYCDDTIPSRIDFAKQRYGGPFTTEEVEDVKSFFQVFLVLLALGPVFVVDFSTSSDLFSIFSLHTGQAETNSTCEWRYMVLDSGFLSSFTELIFFPIYIWVVYSVLRNRIPKILRRLGLAVFLYVLAVVSMFTIDLTGHIILHAEHKPNVMCMFTKYNLAKIDFPTLNIHWSVLIFPSVLKNTARDLIMATAFEFISAQSPHSMKGVLVGTLYAIGGLFELLGTLLLPPFAVSQIWEQGSIRDNPPVTSCGFGYYLTIIVIALIGFCLFIVAVKKYKYRKREDEPYSQAQVEEIFSRRVQENQPLLLND